MKHRGTDRQLGETEGKTPGKSTPSFSATEAVDTRSVRRAAVHGGYRGRPESARAHHRRCDLGGPPQATAVRARLTRRAQTVGVALFFRDGLRALIEMNRAVRLDLTRHGFMRRSGRTLLNVTQQDVTVPDNAARRDSTWCDVIKRQDPITGYSTQRHNFAKQYGCTLLDKTASHQTARHNHTRPDLT
jgi:hypothetical protein